MGPRNRLRVSSFTGPAMFAACLASPAFAAGLLASTLPAAGGLRVPALISAGPPSPGLSASASDSVQPFPVRELAEGVYAVPGDSGRGSEGRPNAGFVVTKEGVIVIDALASPLQGERLVRSIRNVTSEPIRWLILTHHHPDHHFGAVALRRAGARVLAHPDRATVAAEAGEAALAEDWTRVVGAEEMRNFEYGNAPDGPVTADTTLTAGGRTVRILHPGPAHTPGDLAVWLPAERVLFAGDLLIEDGVTMVVDGHSGVLLAGLDRLDSLDATVVVPGHGRISYDPARLIQLTRSYVQGLRSAIEQAIREGRSMNQILAGLPAGEDARPVSLASRKRRNAVRVYLEVERELMGLDSQPGTERAAADSPGPPAGRSEP